MQIRPTAFTIGLIIHPSIALFCVYTEFGIDSLIEVNDGYALGCYGLFYIDYTKLLSARWAELTGTEDECAFDIR